MTSTEKLIKKEFKLKTEEEMYALIETKKESFFKSNFFTDKETYTKMIKSLVRKINSDGESYSEFASMARTGSILESASTSAAFGIIKQQYQKNRKTLVNHIRFFL
ncbi:MAG: hypothetical protein H6600_03660 [Flavobacteriales bacterium]|nr:hypothetical protein [Flavobacteriales bacterium]